MTHRPHAPSHDHRHEGFIGQLLVWALIQAPNMCKKSANSSGMPCCFGVASLLVSILMLKYPLAWLELMAEHSVL